MKSTLRYISISHNTATVTQREQFYIADPEKHTVVKHLCTVFPDVTGLLLLVTCNRTEVYFESEITTTNMLRDEFISLILRKRIPEIKAWFSQNDTTESSVMHLLKVSSGLDSKVLGDAEIICQIKKAYQLSITHKLQGSLLERAMQSVFKCHKRISNETHFRDGTTSVAYKALKMIRSTYESADSKEKKILFVGAGEIVRQLFKYNSKFNFKQLYISNRTNSKAISIAKMYECKLYEWEKVLANDFGDFDVIISGVSNRHHLITNLNKSSKKRVLIDLALPGNINPMLAEMPEILFYDLDTISLELEDTKATRLAAIQKVAMIKQEELNEYNKWYQEAPLRATLANYKIELNQKVAVYVEENLDPMSEKQIKVITDRVMRNLLKESNLSIPAEEMNEIIAAYANL
ncbi:hypothetical protein [uncultured Eudoraea sp.]|uniref:hypothetical protein n=1 Tax=uncultured Eudoraea sp. TaxID=1035614 RepID=UPI002611E5B2|nr:hypothetical protein [uncultured Eudoraea sp.]